MADFDQRAEAVIQGAKTIARECKSYQVCTMHLLLAYLQEEEKGTTGLPWTWRDAGIIFPKAWENAPKYHCETPDNTPWSRQAQNVLDEARRCPKKSWQDCWGMEHILIGLLKLAGPDSAIKLAQRCAPGFNPQIVLNKLSPPQTAAPQTVKPTPKNRKQEVRVHIRWMIRRDMPEVLDVENGNFEFPWMDEDFVRCLRQRNCIGMVAEHEDKVVGFMIYELHKCRIHVLNFAVLPEYQRHGVGSQMVAKLIAKLSTQRRSRIVLEVRETNLTAQLFFRENGFRAISVLRSFYEDTPEDAYLMQYRYRPEGTPPVQQTLCSVAAGDTPEKTHTQDSPPSTTDQTSWHVLNHRPDPG